MEGARVRLVLLDIEGTTTPIAFVRDVLFPFARLRLGDWLTRHADTDSRRDIVETLRVEHEADLARGEAMGPWGSAASTLWRSGDSSPWSPGPSGPGHDNPDDRAVVAYATWLMDRDRKSPGLKRVQGLIWEEGYQAGLLHGEVYPDVPPAIRRWRMSGVDVAIYSSGSELAQRRLFASTAHGDLTPLFSGFFDTSVGPKIEPASYHRIASALAHEPVSTLFVSDVTRELRAADAAGCQTRLCVRPGNADQPDAGGYVPVTSFADIQIP